MARMKSSWDDDTHQHFLKQLVDAEFDAEDTNSCDRQLFPELDRQPDLSITDESGEVTDFVYLLQPDEVDAELFEKAQYDLVDHVWYFVPHEKLETVREAIKDQSDQIDVRPFRIQCGQLQVISS